MRLGPFPVDPPVVLAPMAGITNVAFRQLCREQGAGIYVCEMITTLQLAHRNPQTEKLIAFAPEESPRSLQLYGVDPEVTARAVRRVVDEDLADHVDLNFGCSVRKITSKGGGSAIPWKRRLFADIVSAAVRAAEHIPVTIKMRKGIDDDHLTFVEAGLIAQDCGVQWVALHARTAAQRYSGTADWAAIAELKDALDVPVLGNGDIWTADDALRMVKETGCDGVVVGRGCLGKPWLFADLAYAFRGLPDRVTPALGEVAGIMGRHAALLAAAYTKEKDALISFRKHITWYLQGFDVATELRRRFGQVCSVAELEDLLALLDHAQPYPAGETGPRGRITEPGKVFLPQGWLADRDDRAVPEGAELDDSGG
ncbi:tRNA dihydrouridine synthase DusB [Longispora albida]|uniref:tRNA dihydrouridine synthase DusB n=1 Tax=Longispora albida TaxID=203523 RepID=UPI000686629B|nr:tRNA dihydrouridine synthase DusB [Longispora albida]